MNPYPARRRGQPIVAFCALMGIWLAIRMVTTVLPGPPAAEGRREPVLSQIAGAAPSRSGHGAAVPHALPAGDGRTAARPVMPGSSPAMRLPPLLSLPHSPLQPPAVSSVPPPAFVTGQDGALQAAPLPGPQARPNPMIAGCHQLLFLAAFSQMPLPAEVMPLADSARRRSGDLGSRWSADGWLLLRRGGGAPALSAIGGSYGASQAGAVLRYRIDRASKHQLAAYLRTSAALAGLREREAAIGLSARPIASLPIAAMAEARVARTAATTRLRPAAGLVTQLAPVVLPLGFAAEAYGQAGWVGGAGATAFADGQLRIERRLAQVVGAELEAGAGTWGGAQKGVSRLDVGPTARVTLHPSRSSTLRLAADWRFRLAGNAAPQSGPAITLSAGF